jgi:hypothetical protein
MTGADIGTDAGTSLPLGSFSPFSPVTVPPPIGDRQYPPQSAQNQASRGESSFFDSSGPIFSVYLEIADGEDKKMAESWNADTKGFWSLCVPIF